jgi:hypothetical protein
MSLGDRDASRAKAENRASFWAEASVKPEFLQETADCGQNALRIADQLRIGTLTANCGLESGISG